MENQRDAGIFKFIPKKDIIFFNFRVVEFASNEGAQNAIAMLNETELNGRKIFVKEVGHFFSKFFKCI